MEASSLSAIASGNSPWPYSAYLLPCSAFASHLSKEVFRGVVEEKRLPQRATCVDPKLMIYKSRCGYEFSKIILDRIISIVCSPLALRKEVRSTTVEDDSYAALSRSTQAQPHGSRWMSVSSGGGYVRDGQNQNLVTTRFLSHNWYSCESNDRRRRIGAGHTGHCWILFSTNDSHHSIIEHPS